MTISIYSGTKDSKAKRALCLNIIHEGPDPIQPVSQKFHTPLLAKMVKDLLVVLGHARTQHQEDLRRPIARPVPYLEEGDECSFPPKVPPMHS